MCTVHISHLTERKACFYAFILYFIFILQNNLYISAGVCFALYNNAVTAIPSSVYIAPRWHFTLANPKKMKWKVSIHTLTRAHYNVCWEAQTVHIIIIITIMDYLLLPRDLFCFMSAVAVAVVVIVAFVVFPQIFVLLMFIAVTFLFSFRLRSWMCFTLSTRNRCVHCTFSTVALIFWAITTVKYLYATFIN